MHETKKKSEPSVQWVKITHKIHLDIFILILLLLLLSWLFIIWFLNAMLVLPLNEIFFYYSSVKFIISQCLRINDAWWVFASNYNVKWVFYCLNMYHRYGKKTEKKELYVKKHISNTCIHGPKHVNIEHFNFDEGIRNWIRLENFFTANWTGKIMREKSAKPMIINQMLSHIFHSTKPKWIADKLTANEKKNFPRYTENWYWRRRWLMMVAATALVSIRAKL